MPPAMPSEASSNANCDFCPGFMPLSKALPLAGGVKFMPRWFIIMFIIIIMGSDEELG